MQKAIMIQARLSSTRFPQKMMQKIGNIPLIEYVYRRCLSSHLADKVVILTSTEKSDDALYEYCTSKQFLVYRGPLDNVLQRYVAAAGAYKCDIICRVCGDSPFVSVQHIDAMFSADIALNGYYDYMYYTSVIPGFISETFTRSTLEKLSQLTTDTLDLEHVTRYIKNHLAQFRTKHFTDNICDMSLQDICLTIDYKEDLELANWIVRKGLDDYTFSIEKLVSILRTNFEYVKKYKRAKQ